MEQEYVKLEYGKIVSDPGPLPYSYQLEDGTWITGFNHLSVEDAFNYGYVPVIWPEINYDPETQDIRYFGFEVNPDGKSVSPTYEIVVHPTLVPNPDPIDAAFDGVTIAFIKGNLLNSEDI